MEKIIHKKDILRNMYMLVVIIVMAIIAFNLGVIANKLNSIQKTDIETAVQTALSNYDFQTEFTNSLELEYDTIEIYEEKNPAS